jgi:hypothetical protein
MSFMPYQYALSGIWQPRWRNATAWMHQTPVFDTVEDGSERKTGKQITFRKQQLKSDKSDSCSPRSLYFLGRNVSAGGLRTASASVGR